MLEQYATSPRLRLPKLHAAQRRMVDNRARFNVCRMGRRFGKTKLGIVLTAEDAARGYPVGWFAPSYRYIAEVWREAKSYLRPIIVAKNEAEHRMELSTGGIVEFWSLDGDDPARGRRYKRIIVDEAAMAKNLLDKWNKAIRPTLTDYRGDAWFFSTPKGRNEFAHLYTAAESREGWATFHAPSAANPHLHPDEIEAARLDLPDLVFRQEYLADFIDFEGTAVRREWLQYAPPPLHDLRIGMGVDLAISTKDTADYTAVAVVGVAIDGRRFVLDVQRGRMTFRQAYDFIVSMASKWKPGRIAVEQVQYQAAMVQELLAGTSLPVVGISPDRDKLVRFGPMISRYERGMVYHAPGLPGAYEEELLSFPHGHNDDQVDAVGMAHDAAMQSGAKIAIAGTLSL